MFGPSDLFRAQPVKKIEHAVLVVFLLGLLKLAVAAHAQPVSSAPQNPLDKKPWNLGVFGSGGFASNYGVEEEMSGTQGYGSIDLHLFNAGVHAGKVLTQQRGPSFLRGQFELGAELIPYWQAHYPSQAINYRAGRDSSGTGVLPPQNRFGITATPLLCRWNFTKSARFLPWVQLGGGLLWTNHKFPQYPYRMDTSVINFTPQAGLGMNVFRRAHQSLFFAVNLIHISSASLGDTNPGVPITTQFSIGYSWWK